MIGKFDDALIYWAAVAFAIDDDDAGTTVGRSKTYAIVEGSGLDGAKRQRNLDHVGFQIRSVQGPNPKVGANDAMQLGHWEGKIQRENGDFMKGER